MRCLFSNHDDTTVAIVSSSSAHPNYAYASPSHLDSLIQIDSPSPCCCDFPSICVCTSPSIRVGPISFHMENGTAHMSDSRCWVTLVTKASYLPGVIIPAHTLDKHQSRYPLIVQYTSSLTGECIDALNTEGKNHGRIVPMPVDLLLPRAGQESFGGVAKRFKDTFTKLRAFEVYRLGYTHAAFLDADMAVFRNPDEVFEIDLPGRDWIGANNICCCNLDKDSWAPAEWTKQNCPYTALRDSHEVAPTPTTADLTTRRSLNGGLFIFFPSERLWKRLLGFFNTTDKLKTYQFPDQDFLADFFSEHWQPVSWKYNAIKTMKYWHPQLWSDDELVILHYIVDKPWERAVSEEGVAGHLGRDGITHQWWWDIYNEWTSACNKSSQGRTVLRAVEELVGNQAPCTTLTPLPQEPGKPGDAAPRLGLPR